MSPGVSGCVGGGRDTHTHMAITRVHNLGEALEQHLKAAPTPADPPTLEIHALVQVELHDLRERGEHSNVTWDERVCGWWEVQTHGHHTGAQLR